MNVFLWREWGGYTITNVPSFSVLCNKSINHCLGVAHETMQVSVVVELWLIFTQPKDWRFLSAPAHIATAPPINDVGCIASGIANETPFLGCTFRTGSQSFTASRLSLDASGHVGQGGPLGPEASAHLHTSRSVRVNGHKLTAQASLKLSTQSSKDLRGLTPVRLVEIYAASLTGSRKASATGSVAPLAEEEGAELAEVERIMSEILGPQGGFFGFRQMRCVLEFAG